MKKFLIVAALSLYTLSARAAIQEREVTYSADGTPLKGYIAYDDAVQGKRPGVLVVHEWWGLNDYARSRARKLAEQGYTALALDMYGNGKQALHPDDAGKFAGEVAKNAPVARARFEAALNLLKQEPTVDANNIGAVGYCFGGSVVLEMARAGENLKVVESFHGGLSTQHPAERGKVAAWVASFSGEADPMIPAKHVEAFKKEMENAGATFMVVTYPGVEHSFTNPDATRYGEEFKLPLAYNAGADKDSWAQGMAFMKDAFKGN